MNKQNFPTAVSITHQHIVAIINSFIENGNQEKKKSRVRILDVGCGNGRLLSHILEVLPMLQPSIQFDVFGLDVTDARQQRASYMEETKQFLSQRHPLIEWNNQLSLISVHDVWPFPDNSFDFITSNQVLEHVRDHDFAFREIHRCLRTEGVSINIFPTREVLWEGHALMPFVHKVRNVRRRAKLILFFAKLGFKALYYGEMDRRGWRSLEEFAEVFAHVLETDTNYLTARELAQVAERATLKASFIYTKDYFLSKLFSYFGHRTYMYKNLGLIDKLGYLGGRYIASVTFLLRKDN